jgi:hypothetical protein
MQRKEPIMTMPTSPTIRVVAESGVAERSSCVDLAEHPEAIDVEIDVEVEGDLVEVAVTLLQERDGNIGRDRWDRWGDLDHWFSNPGVVDGLDGDDRAEMLFDIVEEANAAGRRAGLDPWPVSDVRIKALAEECVDALLEHAELFELCVADPLVGDWEALRDARPEPTDREERVFAERYREYLRSRLPSAEARAYFRDGGDEQTREGVLDALRTLHERALDVDAGAVLDLPLDVDVSPEVDAYGVAFPVATVTAVEGVEVPDEIVVELDDPDDDAGIVEVTVRVAQVDREPRYHAEASDDGWIVRDVLGGVWHPGEDAARRIAASNVSAKEALAIARDEPMAGEWRS